jgi:hypothetical protein
LKIYKRITLKRYKRITFEKCTLAKLSQMKREKNGTKIGIHWDHLSLDVDPIHTISDSK